MKNATRVVLAGLLLGCGAPHPAPPRAAPRFPVNTRLLLVPLENLSGNPDADEIVLRLIDDSLRSRGLSVAGWAQNLPVGRLATPIEIQQSAASLRASYALTGTLTEFGYRSGAIPGEPAEPIISVEFRLLEVATGHVIWEANFGDTSARRIATRRDLGAVALHLAEDVSAALSPSPAASDTPAVPATPRSAKVEGR